MRMPGLRRFMSNALIVTGFYQEMQLALAPTSQRLVILGKRSKGGSAIPCARYPLSRISASLA